MVIQELIIINEAALYKLSFRSNKAEADKFTNWVVSEVLPAIRKTGSYTIPGKEQPDALRDITIKLLTDETDSAFNLLRRYVITGNQGQKGLQISFRDAKGELCYEPTEKGMPFAVFGDSGKKQGKSTRKKRLLWKKSVIGVVLGGVRK